MIIKIISAVLILITVFFSLKHGWSGITNNLKPEEAKMMSDIGIGHNMILLIAILSLIVAVLVVFPQTFFIANVINATIILMIMAFALKEGNIKTALVEIPFLLMPLIMIYLGHPLKK
ncbi:hypothetical protein [Aurantibacillus circumpalustris]|uniref:hypothetical protein n=1 Tax=Aurantibacillus circumpalustris TaxID=3036359 RepID=UPI00295A6146|nr:hypothetical protein [Aurantibacillus circumpalustris]